MNIPELESVWFDEEGYFYIVELVCNLHSSSDQFPVTVAFRQLNSAHVSCMNIELFNSAMTICDENTSFAALTS